MHPISKNTCLKCAQVLNGTHCTNRECSDGLNVFGRVYAFGVKDGSLQEAILAFKDNHTYESHMAVPLGKILAHFILRNASIFQRYNFFLPMPKHPESVSEKGFDQVSEIYQVAAPFVRDLFRVDDLRIAPYLIQCKKVPSLRRLGARERRENVRDAFCLSFDTDIFRGKNVLIFDDVLTSGATLSAAAEALRQAGADTVDGIVLARSQWRS